MALFGIGKTHVSLKLYQNEKWYETVCQEITLTREPNVAAKLTTKIYRDAITAERGDLLRLTIDEQHHQFLGVITESEKSGPWCTVTAYDQLYYLNKSKIYYTYEAKTASQVLLSLRERLGLKMVDPPHVMNTEYVIPYRIEDGSTPLDILQTALDLTYANTGKKFYIWDDCGNLCLHSEQWLMQQANLLISMEYITDYSYREDMNDIITKVTIMSEVSKDDETTGEKKGTRTFYTAEDAALANKYGTIEYSEKLSEGENGDVKAQTILKEHNSENQRLSISGCQGNIVVRGGTPLFVDFFSVDNKEYIRGYFKTESVTHHIKAGHHTMDLDLSLIEMYNDWTDREIGKRPALDEGTAKHGGLV